LAIDLCCGTGGWARGLIMEGFDVIGFDVVRFVHPKCPAFPGPMVIQDVRTLSGASWRGKVDLIVASPPCQEFSRRRMPYRRPGKARPELYDGPPDLSIVEACFRIAREAAAPLVLENTQGAVKYLGKPRHRCGPFYLWGDGVPFLLPRVGPCKMIQKPTDHRHVLRAVLRAIVPLELARAVGRYHATTWELRR